MWLEVDTSHPPLLSAMLLKDSTGADNNTNEKAGRRGALPVSEYPHLRLKGAYTDFAGRDRFVELRYLQTV